MTTSTVEIVAKATSILSAIDNHVNDNCEHCRELLKSAVGTNHSNRQTAISPKGELEHDYKEH
jgi:hypothetical protein